MAHDQGRDTEMPFGPSASGWAVGLSPLLQSSGLRPGQFCPKGHFWFSQLRGWCWHLLVGEATKCYVAQVSEVLRLKNPAYRAT